jgi:glycosyltransferase involved in cell wall biosynthesis
MRIAQVAPLFESVPPRMYGGTERVVAFLTEALVTQGHDVTLFASGDSTTQAKLVATCRQALRLRDNVVADQIAPHIVQLEEVYRRRDDFDVIHFHAGYLHLPVARRLQMPHLTTLHGRLDLPELAPLFREFPSLPLVSITDAQRRPLLWANWLATVHHGVPPQRFHFQPTPGDYLVFLGRISPEKRVDRAIEIALRFEMPIRIAAKVDPVDRAYFEARIEPLLQHPLVEYLGEVGDRDKDELLGHARALLFPIDWPEPFGLVMIEALACGTPVIAYRHGSVPEIIEDGVTGFVVNDIESAVQAAGRVHTLNRADCRTRFEQHFTAERMALRYLDVYDRVAAHHGLVPGEDCYG